MTPRDQPLTREVILAEALRIVDEKGLPALSMRTLAGNLGIEAMSLYHHFANKDAILDGLAASVLLSMRPPTSIEKGWRSAAEEACVTFRATLLAHPNVIPILITRPFNTEATMPLIEDPVGAVIASGIEPQTAAELYMALVALVFGHAALSAQSEGAGPRGAADTTPAHVAAELDAGTGRYPVSAAAGPALFGPSEESFRRAVRALIVGYTAP